MNNWISVKDRLPEYNERVLIFNTVYDTIFIGYLDTDEWCIDGLRPPAKGNPFTNRIISYWMPLPKEPKE